MIGFMKAILMWWAALLAAGIAFWPLTRSVFRRFSDRGWLFGRMIGLFLSAWCLWALNCGHLVRFGQRQAVITVTVLAAACYGLWALAAVLKKRRAAESAGTEPEGTPAGGRLPAGEGLRLILAEELLFFGLFAAAVYVIGFSPAAYGTEKFMDYGFLTAMARSSYMPFQDMWYAGETINYYYGGQYMTAFLMRLSGVTAGEAYTLMRALITASSFMLPFCLVHQLLRDRFPGPLPAAGRKSPEEAASGGPASRFAGCCGGLLAGTAVAFCGNLHYIVYGLLLPALAKPGDPHSGYWFPDSTRFIGYDPDLPDKTIHEFPAYSSVLGDLHAHYCNILFVVTVAAIAYAWAQKRTEEEEAFSRRMPAFLAPEVLLTGFMTGAFRWTNFWDFPIYYVVCGSIFFFVLLGEYRKRLLHFVPVILALAAVMFGCGYLAALPFTVSFVQISSEIGLTHSHSLWWQLLILWGLPAACLAGYIAELLCERHAMKRAQRKEAEGAAVPPVPDGTGDKGRGSLALPDLAALLYALCAAGLVLLPELIYVKDIYGEDHYRANTMFKLSYQAFILFGMCMAYILVRSLVTGLAKGVSAPGRAARLIPGAAGTLILLLSAGYTGTAVQAWFGNVLDPSGRIHTDASVFVSESFPGDYEAVNFLNANVAGEAVILEAPGESYSDSGRISVATGLSAVVGWRVHEWLWRGNPDEVARRMEDCEEMYTSADEERVRELLDRYGVDYIYIGDLERSTYPELNVSLLSRMGETIYQDDWGTRIIRVP